MEGRSSTRNEYPAPALEGGSPTWSRVEVAPGVAFQAVTDADEPISRCLAAGVFPDDYRKLLDLLRRVAEPGQAVLDLGAHIGTFSLAAAASGFTVIAVEASPANAALLQASAERNGFDRLTVIHAAVSDKRGALEFCPIGPYGHVYTAEFDSPSVKVPAVRVDDLLAELGSPRIGFIKIDVEGSEVAALRGMRRLAGGADGPPLFVESNGFTLSFFQLTPRDLKAEMERLGYRSYMIEDDHLVPVSARDFQPSTLVDYLALKQIPAGLRSWRIDRALPLSEMQARALATCGSANEAERLYMAQSLPGAPRAIRKSAAIQQAFQALQRDAHDRVRAAAQSAKLTSWKDWMPG